jgi:hypothetical protein
MIGLFHTRLRYPVRKYNGCCNENNIELYFVTQLDMRVILFANNKLPYSYIQILPIYFSNITAEGILDIQICSGILFLIGIMKRPLQTRNFISFWLLLLLLLLLYALTLYKVGALLTN